MKGMPGLIRLHRWQLDEKRRQLVELQRLQDELQEQLARLEAEIKGEQRTAAVEVATTAYGPYAQLAVMRRTKINHSLADVGRQINEARDAVSEAFQELKRSELLQEQRQKRALAVADRRATIEQDELGLRNYRRQQSERD